MSAYVIALAFLLAMCGKEEDKPKSCTTERVKGGSIIKCGNDEAFVKDGERGNIGEKGDAGERGAKGDKGEQGEAGENGENGENGSDAITTILNPCGPDGDKPQEVILVLSDGTHLAWYKNIGLYVLKENTPYITTDSQSCRFKIVDGELVYD